MKTTCEAFEAYDRELAGVEVFYTLAIFADLVRMLEQMGNSFYEAMDKARDILL